MSKTIKELADALGVSKTAVRKYMTPEFRCEHVETTGNGVITIDSDGCKLIAMHLQRTEKLAESTENKIPETAEITENLENLVIPRVVWGALQEQLVAKDKQIENLQAELAEERKHSRELIDRVAVLAEQAQALHAGTIKTQLPAGDSEEELAVATDVAPNPEPEQRRPWWKKIFG